MLQNSNALVSIIGQLAAVTALIAGPLIHLWGRVNVLAEQIKQHEEKLASLNSVSERLTRIETLLELLVKERGH